MSYDSHCEELAELFLGPHASKPLTEALAQCIQDSIEDWMQHQKAKLERTLGL